MKDYIPKKGHRFRVIIYSAYTNRYIWAWGRRVFDCNKVMAYPQKYKGKDGVWKTTSSRYAISACDNKGREYVFSKPKLFLASSSQRYRFVQVA